jgi:predicted aspartyl protease
VSLRRRADRISGRRAYGGVLVVPCLVHDAYRYWFLVDTGTVLTTINRYVAEELGLDLDRPLRQQRIASVHRADLAPVVCLTSLQVGPYRLAGVEALVLELPPLLRVDGLLGVNFLEHFRPTFEFEQAVLVLRRRAVQREWGCV